jgi:hypothetical protein
MKTVLSYLLLASAASLCVASTAAPADAKGCIKGAVVGGAAGHLAHHTFLGAAAGCIIGHHEAAKKAKEQQQLDTQQQPSASLNPAPASAPATKP